MLAQHLLRIHEILVVVRYPLETSYVSYGTQGCSTDLSNAFRDVVGHSEDLLCVLVEQQMEITKMLPSHVPVKVLGLEIERKHVGE